MANACGAGGPIPDRLEDVTVSFGERFAASEKFDAIFKEGMAQVERAAHYLDGQGKAEAKRLEKPAGFAYATESMRLTTRLMSVAQWLMIRRALKDGDISAQEARSKLDDMTLGRIGRPAHVVNFDDLPAAMRQIIHDSHGLHNRIIQLDRAIECGNRTLGSDAVGAPVNDIERQKARIEAAFAGQLPRARAG